MTQKIRDHGGGIDAAIAQYGGTRDGWLDLSTGINPQPYPLPPFQPDCWTSLPDKAAFATLEAAARSFWNIPDGAAVIAAPGASSLIARIPQLSGLSSHSKQAQIADITYNEHAAAFRSAGWKVSNSNPGDVRVVVHPNNPTATFCTDADERPGDQKLLVIDESFCDVAPDRSLINTAGPGVLILKSFGKFWGLAGLRLGFAVGDPALIAQLRETLGPWQVSGPAITTGIAALNDQTWAIATRKRLTQDANRLDRLMHSAGATPIAGTGLFQLYTVDNAQAWQARLAQHQILTRSFPYSKTMLRLGLPAADRWPQLEAAL